MVLFAGMGIWKADSNPSKYNMPVAYCSPPTERRRHLYFLPAGKKMKIESTFPHQKTSPHGLVFVLVWVFRWWIRTHLNATVRWTVARDGLTERILYFLPTGKKMQTESTFPHQVRKALESKDSMAFLLYFYLIL